MTTDTDSRIEHTHTSLSRTSPGQTHTSTSTTHTSTSLTSHPQASPSHPSQAHTSTGLTSHADMGPVDQVRRGAAPARSRSSFAGDPTSQHSLVRLQREWGHLARSPQALAAVHGWALHIVPFRSLDDVLVAAGLGLHGRAGDRDDELMGQLVRLARDHTLAGRIVLQRLLPGVSSIARRRTGAAHTTVLLDVTDNLLVAAWSVIRTYRVERYPTYIVPSMLREIERRTFRPDRRRRVELVAVGDEVLDGTAAVEPPPTAAHELAELLADAARSGLDVADLELVRRLAAGTSTAALAVERAVTDRTIRNHRAAVVYRLRAVALADAG
jgi:DNA-binding CsgD family transcriptional regulator